MQRTLRFITTLGLPEDRKAGRELDKENGIILHPLAAWRIGIVAIVGLAALVSAILGASPSFIGAILAAGALLVTYTEWMLGRRESSMDKFYERLEIANEHRSNLADTGMRMCDAERYVFTELDNLEYVIERYWFGYMSPSLALRGVDTFASRLGIDGFENEVSRLIDKDCAYNKQTCKVVRKLIAKRSRDNAGAAASTARVA